MVPYSPVPVRFYAPARPDRQTMLNVLNLSIRPSVCSFLCYQTCEHDYFETNEPILMQICTQLRRSSRAEVNNFLFAYAILIKRVYFRQYFVCLRERIFNCCNVLSQS